MAGHGVMKTAPTLAHRAGWPDSFSTRVPLLSRGLVAGSLISPNSRDSSAEANAGIGTMTESARSRWTRGNDELSHYCTAVPFRGKEKVENLPAGQQWHTVLLTVESHTKTDRPPAGGMWSGPNVGVAVYGERTVTTRVNVSKAVRNAYEAVREADRKATNAVANSILDFYKDNDSRF